MATAPTRPLIAVDVGNTQIKLACFSAGLTGGAGGIPLPERIVRLSNGAPEWAPAGDLLPAEPADWVVATVNRPAARRLAAWARASRPQDRYQCLENRDIPITVRVDEPDRVGADRLLAALAVNHLRDPARGAVVVDAGSAITVDAVAPDGAFLGGVILPGFRMAARALATQTDLLPLVELVLDDAPPAVIGKATAAAIRSGLFWGSVGAVREIVRRVAQELGDQPPVFIAGGDAAKLAAHLDQPHCIVSELVLAGIALTARAGHREPEARP